MIQNAVYNEYDLEAAKKLDAFLPDMIFDAHMHPYDQSFCPVFAKDPGSCLAFRKRAGMDEYIEDMKPFYGNRAVYGNLITYPDVSQKDPATGNLDASIRFNVEELNAHPGCSAEVLVFPHDTAEDVEGRLVHDRIRGLKCYHVFADKQPTFQAGIGEYLPEAAWEVANRHHLAITLHMVRDKALADPGNLAYILEMAARYPNATLILAHAARSFASWTAIESVDAVKSVPNVWFDFAAVCEPQAIFYILKKCGVSRCMFGTDYPVSRLAGKCISLADTFYWIGEKDLRNFAGKTTLHTWNVATETLMAQRLALLLYEASPSEVEDVFGKNAQGLFLGN